MTRLGSTALLLLGLLAPLLAGCVRTGEGVAIRNEDLATSTSIAPSPSPTTADAMPAAPGIVSTTRTPIPAGTVTCPQPDRVPRMAVSVADPNAPRITLALPAGWGGTPDTGDAATVKLSGPAGMFATVAITQTTLEPAAAFTDYANKVMAVSAVSSVSVLPDELCGYSGQKLMGAWSDTPQQSVEFLDRIVHVWTNENDYLVAVHVQAPTGTAGFDAAASTLIGDFAVEIP